MRKLLAALLAFLVIISTVFLQPTEVKAESKTIVVPDDYHSIASAIGNATNGDTILVRSGTYEGPINATIAIAKSISIIGENSQNTVIKLYPAYSAIEILGTPVDYTYTDALAITADSCVLQDLTIEMANPGFVTMYGNHILFAENRIISWGTVGITVKGSNCRVTKNTLDGLIQVYGDYNQIDANQIRWSIYLGNIKGEQGSFNIIKDNNCRFLGLTYSANNIILNNIISDSGGINLSWSNNNLIYKNRVSGQIPQNYGIRFWLSSNNVIKFNTISFSGSRTIELGGAYDNLFELNNFIGNTIANQSFVYDDFSDHNYHTYVTSFSTSLWSEDNLGNYWSDYTIKYPNATEIENSGVGDTPYIIDNNNIDSYPLISSYDISTETIQMPDWTTSIIFQTVVSKPNFPSPRPSTTPMQTSSSSPMPFPTVSESTVTPTPYLPSDRNAPHLDPIYYLIPITVIFVAVVVSVFLYRNYRKRHSEK